MFSKRKLLKKFDSQRKIKELRTTIAVYKNELEREKEAYKRAKETNQRLRREMKKKTNKNKVLLQCYYHMKDIVDKSVYPMLNDLQLVKGGIDDLERLECFNDKQDEKIESKPDDYIVS